jgi:hypothetical protein
MNLKALSRSVKPKVIGLVVKNPWLKADTDLAPAAMTR